MNGPPLGWDFPPLGLVNPQTVAELIATPRPQWLVRDVLAQGALAVLYGEPGCGKSFLAIDMAGALVRGRPWLGHRTRQGGVLYLALEGAMRGRVEAYIVHHGLHAEALAGLYVHTGSLDLLATGGAESVITAMHAVAELGHEIALVVVDTLNRSMPGGNENAPDDMGTIIAAAGRIQQATGAAVLLIHHAGKELTRGARGHSSLKGAADLELEVVKSERGRTVELTKVKDGPAGTRMGFELAQVDLGESDDDLAEPGERITSCVVVPAEAAPVRAKSRRRDVALDALRECLDEHGETLPATSTIPAGTRAVTLDQWRRRWILRTGYEDATDNSVRKNFDADRLNLLRDDRIVVSRPWVWLP